MRTKIVIKILKSRFGTVRNNARIFPYVLKTCLASVAIFAVALVIAQVLPGSIQQLTIASVVYSSDQVQIQAVSENTNPTYYALFSATEQDALEWYFVTDGYESGNVEITLPKRGDERFYRFLSRSEPLDLSTVEWEPFYSTTPYSIPDVWFVYYGITGEDLLCDINIDRIPTLFEYFLGRDPVGENAAAPDPTMIVDANATNDPSAAVPVYTTLQAAYDAAHQGEVIFVKGNANYDESLLFTAGKSVLFIGDTALGDYPPLIRGKVEVSNAAGIDAVVVMDGFEIEPPEGQPAVVANNGKFMLVNSVVRSNSAIATVLGEDASELKFVHCTLIETPVSFVVDRSTAASVKLDSTSTLDVKSSILWDAGVQQEILAATPANVSAADSTIRGGQYSMSNVNPQLTVMGWLMPTSSARNTIAVELNPVDIHGNARPCGPAADRGADEFTDSTGNGFPDWWELQNFGAIGVASGQAHLNAYRDGTDPNAIGEEPSVDDTIPDTVKQKLGITSRNDDAIAYDNNSMIIEFTGKNSISIERDEEGNITSFSK